MLRVSGPNGYDEVATVLSVVPPVNSAVVTVTVSIPAAGGTWDAERSGSLFRDRGAVRHHRCQQQFLSGGSWSDVRGEYFRAPRWVISTQDGDLDCDDVDALTTAISTGSTDLTFDVTGDGQVNSADLDEWVLNLKGTLFGDANLDLRVDGSDFGIWNGAKFLTGTAWCSGDFNADGRTDGSDFGIWNSNKFQSRQPVGPGVLATGHANDRQLLGTDRSRRTAVPLRQP